LSTDTALSVRVKFLRKLIPKLNSTLGQTDLTFAVELIHILDRNKNDKDKAISDAAFEVDEAI